MPPNYDAGYSNTQNQGLGGFYDPTAYTDSSYAQDKSMKPGGGVAGGNEFEDEPPLLEGKLEMLPEVYLETCIYCLIVVSFLELGINPNHIFQKVSSPPCCFVINRGCHIISSFQAGHLEAFSKLLVLPIYSSFSLWYSDTDFIKWSEQDCLTLFACTITP